MDPLSLLAELYGDGRITVEKFRLHRLTGLKEICARKPKDLARMLALPQRTAQKILSEAREMLQGKLFDQEKSLRGMESQTSVATEPLPDTGESGVRDEAGGAAPSPDPALQGFKTEVLDILAKSFP